MLGEITLTHAAEEELHELQSLLAGIQLDVDVMDNQVLQNNGKVPTSHTTRKRHILPSTLVPGTL